MWLRGLVISPVVFMERGAEFISVIVDAKKWQLKRGVQDGVFQLELDLISSLADYTQAQ
jgi:predicted nuclease of restriction endonuclease-like RecB superfamily